MLPSIAKSGWLDATFVRDGLFGLRLRPEALFGLTGMDNLTHSLFWSLLANIGGYSGRRLLARPPHAEASQALQFVDVFERASEQRVFWKGRARTADLLALVGRFVGAERARSLFAAHPASAASAGPTKESRRGAGRRGARAVRRDALAGAIGSASARDGGLRRRGGETLDLDDIVHIVEEAGELRQLNERLKSLDRLKDDFMSSVTHELRNAPLARHPRARRLDARRARTWSRPSGSSSSPSSSARPSACRAW
ncbi:MAG: hypothetical protein U1F49_07165 [Rubrivivax sp.]